MSNRSDPSLLDRLFSPRSPAQYVFYFLLAFAINRVSNRFPAWSDQLFMGFLVCLFAFVWWVNRRAAALPAVVSLSKQPPERVRGLILLVSPYDPRDPAVKNAEAFTLNVRQVLEKPAAELTDGDFEAIGLARSNLWPLVKAVEYHATGDVLRELWLITTRTEFEKKEGMPTVPIRGSEEAAALLAKYVAHRHGSQVRVHREGLELEGAWDYVTLWRKAEEIFRRSPYKAEALLADVTGGTAMMSVALALACVAPGRRMQYMHTGRDWQGQPLPDREPVPVVIDPGIVGEGSPAGSSPS